ncbi:Transcription attenuation protein MtrB [Bacillus subtilis subsp. subtilis str. BSP1]|nr:Transcription attenuation protein MtrB [Bacillus subtilis subsp. subtilis str. BSP1]
MYEFYLFIRLRRYHYSIKKRNWLYPPAVCEHLLLTAGTASLFFFAFHFSVRGLNQCLSSDFNGRSMLCKLSDDHFSLVEFFGMVKLCVCSSCQADHIHSVLNGFNDDKIT